MVSILRIFTYYASNVAHDIAADASSLQTQPEDCVAIQQAIVNSLRVKLLTQR